VCPRTSLLLALVSYGYDTRWSLRLSITAWLRSTSSWVQRALVNWGGCGTTIRRRRTRWEIYSAQEAFKLYLHRKSSSRLIYMDSLCSFIFELLSCFLPTCLQGCMNIWMLGERSHLQTVIHAMETTPFTRGEIEFSRSTVHSNQGQGITTAIHYPFLSHTRIYLIVRMKLLFLRKPACRNKWPPTASGQAIQQSHRQRSRFRAQHCMP